MTIFAPSSTTTGGSDIVDMAGGDSVYVAAGVNLVETENAFFAILDSSIGTADIYGAVAGPVALDFAGEADGLSQIEIGATGSLTGFGGAAITIGAGEYEITNSGDVTSSGFEAVAVAGPGVIRNYGTIDENNPTGAAIGNTDSTSGDVSYLYNFGTIAGSQDGVFDVDEHTDIIHNYGVIVGPDFAITAFETTTEIVNTGSIDGQVQLGGQNSSLDSTHGTVTGTITCGSGGDTVTEGVTGGTVLGGAGNDKLYASPTLAAADNGAQTTLDGAGGDNWLVGDGGFVTFDSGDGDGGINHINGRLSKMSDVAGDANNTVSYASLSGPYQSVSVDLLTGHAWMSSTANANTALQADLTFEDYLRNVSNVIGSSGADAIFCDNGVDNITAGGAGTMMTAGVGAHSQDTFVFTALTASTAANEDVISGFKAGVDMLDFSDLSVTAANIKITQASNHHFNTVIVEETPGVSNPATNLTLSVHATTATLLTTASIIF